MIITVPCTHPYFLELMKQMGKDIYFNPAKKYEELPLAFIALKETGVVGGATLISSKMGQELGFDYIDDKSPWVMDLFVKESERNKDLVFDVIEKRDLYKKMNQHLDEKNSMNKKRKI